MGKIQLYLNSYNINFLLYLVLTFFIIKLILEQRTYGSFDQKKMYAMKGVAFVLAFFVNFLIFLIYGHRYLGFGIRFMYILPMSMLYYNFILLSIILFEVQYDFYYLKTKISFQNIYPYAILIGYSFINPMLYNSIISFIVSIFYFLYLFRIISNKGNIVRF